MSAFTATHNNISDCINMYCGGIEPFPFDIFWLEMVEKERGLFCQLQIRVNGCFAF